MGNYFYQILLLIVPLLYLIQSLNLEEKRVGAPFAAMLRRHMVDYSEPNDCVLKIVFVLLPASSNVTQVKYSSIVLQVKIRQWMLTFSLYFLKLICRIFSFSFFTWILWQSVISLWETHNQCYGIDLIAQYPSVIDCASLWFSELVSHSQLIWTLMRRH